MMQSLSHYAARAAALNFRTECWIDGRFVPATAGGRFESVNPATGAVLSDLARGGAEDIDRAVRAARAAFEDGRWSRRTPGARKEVLLRLAALLRENLEEFALLDTLDMGKPISETVTVDVPGSAHFFQWHAEAIDKLYDEVAPTGGAIWRLCGACRWGSWGRLCRGISRSTWRPGSSRRRLRRGIRWS